MEQVSAHVPLIAIGAILAVALAANWVGARTPLPRVSLLLLVGVLAGPLVFDVLPGEREQWFPVASRIALVMVGFLIGGEFTRDRLRRQGKSVAIITAGQGLATAAIVAGGLLLVGVDTTVALLLGGVATATDPAATRSVIEDEGAHGDASHTVLGIVALDDVVGIVVFSVLLAGAGAFAGVDGGAGQEFVDGLWELGGGVLVGLAIGLPASQLTGRLAKGEPTLQEALAAVLLCAGITWWLDVSYLIAAVVMGTVIANLASHHERSFRAVEGIEWPFLVIFFVLAGAEISRDTLSAAALIAGYVLLRTIGKTVGSALSARSVGMDWRQGSWFGPALLPQAGVALGMALAGAERFPALSDEIVGVAVVSTVLFELVGPIGVRMAIPRLERS